MTRPDLSALELLVAVADHGGVGAAARHLGVAQPNATRTLGRLEHRLGLTLVVRRPRGSVLTPEGLAVAGWARGVLDAMDDLVLGAAALTGSDEQALVVASSQTVAEYLLPGWLAGLRAAGHSSAVDIRVMNSAGVLTGVRSGEIGLGFIETPVGPRGLHSRTVSHDELVTVVAPGHPWASRRTPVPAQVLAATPLVVRESGSGTRDALDHAMREALGRQCDVVRPLQELTSNAAVRVATSAGAGPAVLSRFAVAEALAAGTLCRVRVSGLDLHRSIRAVWSGHKELAGVRAELVEVATRG